MLPREKFTKRGIDALSDSELVAIIVGSGIQGKNFKSLARSIIYKFQKKLEQEKNVTLKDLSSIDGIGQVTAMKILAGIELGRRLYSIRETGVEIVMNSEQAYALLKEIGTRKKEYIVCLFMNSRFEVIKREVISIGSLDGVGIVPRDIIIPALECNAAHVVMAHNHPSGDATPSKEDILVTQRVSEALSLVGLKLIDHLVITEKDWKCIDI